MKKIICIALALVMLLGLAVSASAYDISMAPSADGSGVAGHTYNVYQIYTGTMSVIDGKETLGEVKYGQNYGTEGEAVAEADLAEIAAMTGAEAAEYFSAVKTGDPYAVLNDGNNHTYTGAPAGYYLIIDVSTDLPETETASAFIIEVLDDVAINSKHTSGPKVEKKIDDINDSNFEELEIQWHDSADHDIGDDIPFQLSMTVPSAFQAFKDNNVAYPFTFHDTEEKGLEFNNDAVVYVDGVELTSGYDVVYPAADGHTFDVVFEDLTLIDSVKVGSKITVEYTSELTKDAILGNQGNVNEVFGEFRNYNEPTVPAYTPKDFVIAFTYKVEVNKVDKDNDPLGGATFTLAKFIADSEGAEEYNGVKGAWLDLKTIATTAETVFTFEGIDDGQYRLTEDEAPAGYNKIEPIEFEVTAAHDILWETQGRTDVLTSLTGDVDTGEITFTSNKTDGSLTTDVENRAGTVLPETGGVGTTIFYILGAAMAICAVVVLVSRRRMTAQG